MHPQSLENDKEQQGPCFWSSEYYSKIALEIRVFKSPEFKAGEGKETLPFLKG